MTISLQSELTIMMLSQMGEGDGGRETWLLNFLTEIARQRRLIKFHIIHRCPVGLRSLLDSAAPKGLVASVTTLRCDCRRIPVTVEFIVRVAWERLRGRLIAPGLVLGVGGLSEVLAILALTAGSSHKRNRVLWLRTIYSKEKASQIPKVLRGALLALEIFLIRRFFGLVLANGDDTADFYSEQGIDCVVIKNAIPLATWRMPPIQLKGRLKVAFIGRLSEVKGIAAFLDAVELAVMRGEGDRFEFIVAGDGPYRVRVESLEREGLLSYRGQLDNSAVVGLVSQVDCCVALTYLTDELGGGGVSNALIEQMTAGRIIVAWDNDIFRRVVSPNCAYLIEQGNSNALLSTLMSIDQSRDAALSKASAATHASEAYSIEAHVDRFFQVLGGTAGVNAASREMP